MSKRSSAAASPQRHLTPRERICERGVEGLLDHELVALLIGDGSYACLKRSVELLEDHGGLAGLLAIRRRHDAKHEAPGDSETAMLNAAKGFVMRALLQQMKSRDSLASPTAVRTYLRLAMGHLEHEAFMVLFLDAQNRAIGAEELFRGTLTQTSVYPREVVKRALERNAASVVLAHNHPSGVAEPSIQDQALTRTLAEALALVDVKVLDHFIVAPGSCLSFAERGLI